MRCLLSTLIIAACLAGLGCDDTPRTEADLGPPVENDRGPLEVNRNSSATDLEVERLIAELGEPVEGIHGPYCMPTPRSKADDAYEQLRTHGSVAVPKLISHLGDSNTYRRAHSAGLLGEIGDARAVEPLSKMVAIEVNARDWVISALGKFEDQQAVDALIALLSEGSGETLSLPAVDVSTGRQAAIALAEIGTLAVPSLEASLDSRDSNVRTNAAFALQLISGK